MSVCPEPRGPHAHEKVEAVHAHWASLPTGGTDLPLWSAFDPASIPRLLANVFLIAVEGEPPRFRFRLLGETIRAAGGPGRPGLRVDEIPRTGTAAYLNDQLADIVRWRKPVWYKGPPTLRHHRDVALLEGVMLPMAADDGRVTRILCLTVYHWLDGRVT